MPQRRNLYGWTLGSSPSTSSSSSSVSSESEPTSGTSTAFDRGIRRCVICCRGLTHDGMVEVGCCATLVSNQSRLEVVTEERTSEKESGRASLEERSGLITRSTIGFVDADPGYEVSQSEIQCRVSGSKVELLSKSTWNGWRLNGLQTIPRTSLEWPSSDTLAG